MGTRRVHKHCNVSEDLNELNSEPGSLDIIEVLMILSQTDCDKVCHCVEFRGCSGHWPLTVMSQ